ncbi:MAG: hypothetical protein HY928_10315 [Elusimicrobia bacterium]|nr:hypothetical protein [Elusimicrobiota bacterium]
MSLVVANAGRAVLAALLVFTAATLRGDERSRERTVALVVEARDAEALCRKAGCRPETFLSRLRALGVCGLAVRPEPLSRLVAARKVVRFSEEEVSRLRSTGVAAPGAPLTPGALFVKDEAVLARIAAAAGAQGVRLEQSRFGRMGVLELPAGVEVSALSAGFDPWWTEAASEAGLVPVYRVSGSPDLRLALGADGPGAALLDAAPDALEPEARAGLEGAMGGRRMWAAAGRSGGESSFGGDRVLASAEVRSDVPLDAFLRLVAGRGPSLVVVGLDPQAGPDAAVAALRRLSRGLRAEGTSPAWPSGLFESRRLGKPERAARLLAGFAAAVLFPLLAMRQGLAAARWASRASFLPEASPIREAALGMGVAAACACAGGLVVRALCSGIGVGFGPPPWFSAASAALAGAGFIALWLPDEESWGGLRRGDRALLLRLFAAAAASGFVLFPPDAVRAWAFGLGPLASLRPAWWWAPARWAEMLVGYPALFVGFCRYAETLAAVSGRRTGARDPRAWLFAGLAAPLGLSGALLNARIPLGSVLVHSTHCLAAGAALGALVYLAAGIRGRNQAGS